MGDKAQHASETSSNGRGEGFNFLISNLEVENPRDAFWFMLQILVVLHAEFLSKVFPRLTSCCTSQGYLSDMEEMIPD